MKRNPLSLMSLSGWLTLVSLAIALVLAWLRLRLGLVRYFDMDEYAYLNWASHVASGYRPYIDFLFYPSPLYLYVLAPVAKAWQGVALLVSGRVFALVVFGLLVGAAASFFWELRRSWIAILVALILLVLPMPSDKFLEIRPDTLAMLFVTLGLIMQLRWMREGGPRHAFAAGIWYSLAVLTIQKAGTLAAIALVFMFAHGWHSFRATRRTGLVYLIGGLVLPWLVLGLWAIASGKPELVIYSIVKLPFEVTIQQRPFNQVPPLFYFQPNSTYYGSWGYGWGLSVNNTLWVLGIALAVIKLVTLTLVKPKVRWIEALLPALLLSQVVLYVYASPLKHPQYLIPAAVLVAWMTADGLYGFWRLLTKVRWGKVMFVLLYLGGVAVLVRSFFAVNIPKLSLTNNVQNAKINRIISLIPKDAFVFDLEGRTLSYPYPSYWGCCMAFGQMESSLTRQLPSLSQGLQATRTKYIYQAEINRIGALLPTDAAFIYEHYQSVENGELWVAGDW